MSAIQDVMLDEARQNFFHVVSSAANIDSKAFGFIAFESLMFTVMVALVSYTGSLFWCIPSMFFLASVVCMCVVAWLRKYPTHDTEKVIDQYGTRTGEEAATQLAVDYAELDADFSEIVYRKAEWLRRGLIIMGIGLILVGGMGVYLAISLFLL